MAELVKHYAQMAASAAVVLVTWKGLTWVGDKAYSLVKGSEDQDD